MKKQFSVAVALLVSLFIYLFYRCEKTVVNEMVIRFISLDTYNSIKLNVASAVPLDKFIINSLPGGLWVFCMTILSKDLYLRANELKIQASIVPILFAIMLEFCQLVHLTNGTFDIADIISYLMFWLVALHSFENRITEQSILSPFTTQGFICVACFLTVFLAHVNQ